MGLCIACVSVHTQAVHKLYTKYTQTIHKLRFRYLLRGSSGGIFSDLKTGRLWVKQPAFPLIEDQVHAAGWKALVRCKSQKKAGPCRPAFSSVCICYLTWVRSRIIWKFVYVANRLRNCYLLHKAFAAIISWLALRAEMTFSNCSPMPIL